jgi:hypothetical protein
MPLKLYGPNKIFNAQAVTGISAYRSAVVDMLCMDIAALELEWTGTAVGTLSIDASNNGIVWYPTGTSVNNPTGAGATDDSLIDINRFSPRYLSVSYLNTAGVGTLTITAVAKGLGA